MSSIINSTAKESQIKTVLDMNPHGSVVGLGSILTKESVRLVKGIYNFATQGGAVSTITLKTEDGVNAVIPAGALVHRVYVKTLTACTSGGSATISLDLVTTADMMAATAYSSFVTSGNAMQDGKVDGTAGKIVSPSTDKAITMSIATAALTAGKFEVYALFIMP